jgi:hypothetical protein
MPVAVPVNPRWLMAELALVLVLAWSRTAVAELVYDFQWRSSARLSHWVGSELLTDGGELGDMATLTMSRTAKGHWTFSFKGPGGRGSGVLAPRGPERLVFPVAVAVGRPPAPAHLKGGSFTFTGPPDCPASFQIEYAEGFLCRAVPARCQNVDRWERTLSGNATLTRGDRRCRQRASP